MEYLDDTMLSNIFIIAEKTKEVTQKHNYHPEGSVFEHSLQTMAWAFKESIDIDLILAALLHDVGKTICASEHEKESIKLLDGLISTKTIFLIENHMRIWKLLSGEMKKQGKVLFLTNHPWLSELILLARWDKLSRDKNISLSFKYDKIRIIEKLQICAEKHFKNSNKK